MAMTSQGVYGCTKCICGVFLAEKTRKDTTWSVPIVLKCFLDVQCPVLHHCNPIYSSFHVRSNVQKKLEFFAQFTATMMYYVVVE